MPGYSSLRIRGTWLALGSLAALVAVGCLKMEPVGDLGEPTLANVQSLIFTPKCALAGCHGGSAPREGMSLEPGKVKASTLNVVSVESPLMRIKPGDPDQSYLVAKIEGRAHDVGGSGDRMPLGSPPLSPAEIQLVRDWISSTGVPPASTSNAASAASSVGDELTAQGAGMTE